MIADTGFSLSYKEEKAKGGVLWESHCHARFEMIVVFEGEVTVTLEGRQNHLSRGSVLVISPLLYHTVAASKSTSYHRTTVLFDISAVPLPLREKFLSRTKTGNPLICRDLSSLQRVSPLAHQEFFRPLADSLLVELLYEYTEASEDATPRASDSFLQKAVEYIDQNLSGKVSLDALALHVARSKSSLCHLFRAQMGVTVKQYILEKRMALATKLLSEGKNPTSVASEIGYENYSNFYRIYQKHFGVSPSSMKKE